MSFISKIFSRSAAQPLSRSAALIASSIAFALLAACSSSDPTEVKADFEINGVKGTVSGQNVTIDLTAKESCSTLTSLVTIVQANGASISPDPTVARDYSQPVQFTITAPDGTKLVYTVTVKGNSCGNTPAPAPAPAPAPTTKTCPTHSYGTTGYELVFKSCDTSTGNNLFYDKTECVRDNATGLIWQGQTPAGTGLRANDQYKTNFDSTTAQQKFISYGLWGAPTQAEIDASTNSIGFKNAVNATNLCGSSAWRLPTKDELLGIVKINPTAPMIDADWFPNTNTNPFGLYWTSSPYTAPNTPSYYASTLFFDRGEIGVSYRYYVDNHKILVRLVR